MYSLLLPQSNNLTLAVHPIKNQSLLKSVGNLKKNMQPQWALNLSPSYGQVILVRRIPCFESRHLNHNMNVQYQRWTYGNGATTGIYFSRYWAWHTDVRTVMWQPKFFRSIVTKFSKLYHWDLLHSQILLAISNYFLFPSRVWNSGVQLYI